MPRSTALHWALVVSLLLPCCRCIWGSVALCRAEPAPTVPRYSHCRCIPKFERLYRRKAVIVSHVSLSDSDASPTAGAGSSSSSDTDSSHSNGQHRQQCGTLEASVSSSAPAGCWGGSHAQSGARAAAASGAVADGCLKAAWRAEVDAAPLQSRSGSPDAHSASHSAAARAPEARGDALQGGAAPEWLAAVREHPLVQRLGPAGVPLVQRLLALHARASALQRQAAAAGPAGAEPWLVVEYERTVAALHAFTAAARDLLSRQQVRGKWQQRRASHAWHRSVAACYWCYSTTRITLPPRWLGFLVVQNCSLLLSFCRLTAAAHLAFFDCRMRRAVPQQRRRLPSARNVAASWKLPRRLPSAASQPTLHAPRAPSSVLHPALRCPPETNDRMGWGWGNEPKRSHVVVLHLKNLREWGLPLGWVEGFAGLHVALSGRYVWPATCSIFAALPCSRILLVIIHRHHRCLAERQSVLAVAVFASNVRGMVRHSTCPWKQGLAQSSTA